MNSAAIESYLLSINIYQPVLMFKKTRSTGETLAMIRHLGSPSHLRMVPGKEIIQHFRGSELQSCGFPASPERAQLSQQLLGCRTRSHLQCVSMCGVVKDVDLTQQSEHEVKIEAISEKR